jgi:hypothetical protein
MTVPSSMVIIWTGILCFLKYPTPIASFVIEAANAGAEVAEIAIAMAMVVILMTFMIISFPCIYHWADMEFFVPILPLLRTVAITKARATALLQRTLWLDADGVIATLTLSIVGRFSWRKCGTA